MFSYLIVLIVMNIKMKFWLKNIISMIMKKMKGNE